MSAIRLSDGNLLVPRRAESEDGDAVGDAMVEIASDDPDFASWEEFLRKYGAQDFVPGEPDLFATEEMPEEETP